MVSKISMQNETSELDKKEMEVTVVLKCEDLLSKALSIVEKVNTVENLKEKLDIKWVKRWQSLYGVNKETSETPFDNTQQFIDSDLTSDVTVSVVPATEHESVRNGADSGRTDNAETSHIVSAKKEENDAESMSINEISNGEEVPLINVDMSYPQHVSEYESNIDQQLTNNEIYYAFCFDLDLKYLPDQSYQNVFDNDRVSVLMAANRSGGHRTRVLVAGKEWRPNCLKHVNMVTQPVIYAGGGSGSLTSDLFKWWFHKEFSSTTSMFHSNIVLYVDESNSFVSTINDLHSRNVKLKTLNEQEYNYNLVISEFKTIYTSMLLKHFILSKPEGEVLNVETYIKQYSLKDSFLLIHKSWLSVRPETFLRCLQGIKTEPQVDSKLIFSSSGTENDRQGDTNLLLELQWLTHDLGLEVTDQDLLDWLSEKYKPEVLQCSNESMTIKEEECENIPNAVEVIKHLEKVIQWMESETFDPNYLLCVQDVLVSAKQASKMGLGGAHPAAAAGLSFFCHNGEHPLSAQPPPAHMGIPPYQLDAKHAAAGMGEYWRPPPAASATAAAAAAADWKRLLAATGLSRPPMYSFSPGQYAYPMLSPEMSQVASWHSPSMYPISTAASGPFRSPYPTSLPIPSSSLPSDFYRFSPGLMPPHPGLSPHALASHAAIVTPGPKQELTSASGAVDNHRYARASMDQKNSTSDHNKNNQDGNNSADKKKPHIKKPLNAFMLYMKEMRAKVVAECTLKESAAINQILGRRWHSLSREEQGKYYEKARQERQLHMQLYPGWSARDNYGYGTKKKKRKKSALPSKREWHALGREEQAKYYELARRERQLHMQLYPDWSSRANASRGKKRKRKQETNEGGNSMKKCRARYGLDQQSQWCKPCRRKKKCIRYMETGDSNDGNQSDDNLGSCGSVGEAQTPPDDDTESLNQSLSSPGGLSGLSSLTSPSMILPSPSTSLASPSVSLASPCMSLQSPLTPHDVAFVDCSKPLNLPTTSAISVGSHLNHQAHNHNPPQHRNPVGTNPHDINNPLSVNQLTGQCVKNSN